MSALAQGSQSSPARRLRPSTRRATPRVDGRTARGERARVAVATAYLDLLGQGDGEPTAAQVAARAGVSERLVFHHFSDLEALFTTAAELQLRRMLPLVKPVDPRLPFERRVVAFARTRGRFFERLSPVRRAAMRHEPASPALARILRAAHQFSRNLACSAFNRELAAMPPQAAAEARSALSAISSWETWDFLRRREGLSCEKAARVVARMIRALLHETHPPRKSRGDRGRHAPYPQDGPATDFRSDSR